MAVDAGNSFDFKNALGWHPAPLRDSAVCNPEFPRDPKTQATMEVEDGLNVVHEGFDSTTIINAQSPLLGPLAGADGGLRENVSMPKVRTNFKSGPPRYFIRQWRKHRGLTIEQMAERVNVTHGAISQLERGEINYTQPMLEAIARALSCQPADLIMRDPADESAPWSVIDTLKRITNDEERTRIIRAVKALAGSDRTGTDG